ncbi:hypothetical protein evm_010566 [Chilo suppressalis]|nr:hypothetical protein evm_010566 [Chilo suppressalis]
MPSLCDGIYKGKLKSIKDHPLPCAFHLRLEVQARARNERQRGTIGLRVRLLLDLYFLNTKNAVRHVRHDFDVSYGKKKTVNLVFFDKTNYGCRLCESRKHKSAKIDALMVGEFVALNPDFCSAEQRNDKASMILIPRNTFTLFKGSFYRGVVETHEKLMKLAFKRLSFLVE